MAEPAKKKILVVEDEPSFAKVYQMTLQKAGMEVTICTNGQEGYKVLSDMKPNVVLLDLMMPVRDGFWVLEERNKQNDLKKIPIIVLSNLGQPEDQKRAMDLGAVDYLVKANTPIHDIVERVKKYI